MKKISAILAASLLLGTGYLIAQDDLDTAIVVDEIPMEVAEEPMPADTNPADVSDPLPAPEMVSTESMGATGADTDAPAPATEVAVVEAVATQTESVEAIPPTLTECATAPNGNIGETGVFPAAGDFKYSNPNDPSGHEVLIRVLPDNKVEMFADWKKHAQWSTKTFYAMATGCTAVNHGETTNGLVDNAFKCEKASRHLKYSSGDTSSPQDRQKFVYDPKADTIIHYKGCPSGENATCADGSPYFTSYTYARVTTNLDGNVTPLISSGTNVEDSKAFATAVRAAAAQDGKKFEPLAPGPAPDAYYNK